MTNQELAAELELLASHMREVADEMWEHESGNNAADVVIGARAPELHGASEMCLDWSTEIAKIQVSK